MTKPLDTVEEKIKDNSFDKVVEMFADQGADCIFLSDFDGGMVCGEACRSSDGTTWAVSMFSSIDEAINCKYPTACMSNDKKLSVYLKKHKKVKSLSHPTEDKLKEEK